MCVCSFTYLSTVVMCGQSCVDDYFGTYLFVPFQVHSHVDVFNFSSNAWVDKFDTPKDMAHSHLGIATDGRYIYVVSGQHGPQCRGPINRV